jgi:Flp pilus assembly pilin Flp
MIKIMYQFFIDDQGQDLIEYSLVLAFVALGSAALMTKAGSSVKTIWTSGSTTLSTAAVSAS